MNKFRVRSTRTLHGRVVGSLLMLWLVPACGIEFDSIGQLDGLRVLGVHKDKPIAQPGDTVHLRMVDHDTGDADGDPREVSYFWLAGCENPPNDNYQGCLLLFQDVASQLTALGDPDQELTADAATAIAASLSAAGVSFGFDNSFEFRVDPDIIARKPAGALPYGLNVVFFAACAGQLRVETTGDGFPVACYDEQGERLGARDFVAGYTSVYVYEDQLNRSPEITGMRLGDKQVPRTRVCIDNECDAVVSEKDDACEEGAPDVPRCKRGAARQTCPELELAVVVDPESVDQDAPLSIGGELAAEPMWVNYHTDRGSFASDLVLVNDIESGFRNDPSTKYLSAESSGPAFLWAVVRDNRGGLAWARTSICVK